MARTKKPENRPSVAPEEEALPMGQSAPRETMAQAADRMLNTIPAANDSGVVAAYDVLQEVIGKDQINEAILTLMKYKEGKANLEKKIVENEEWYRLRHWECLRRSKNEGAREVEPSSAWLFNCIANKHADAMDNYPAPNILPREAMDEPEAKNLSEIIPVILEQNNFEQTYDEVWSNKLRSGTGVYGVFWDKSKLNGLGDISVKKIDIISLYWEPGITDIQDSQNIFEVQLFDNDYLLANYPILRGKNISPPDIQTTKYLYDDSVDTSNKSAVVDWYYKRIDEYGKTILHYCKFVGNTVLYASENDPKCKFRGFYDHGRYPFEFDPLFRQEGTPAGFGYIDVGKSAQEYIDRGNQCILENLLANTRPRHFIRNDGSVNEQEYADMTKDFVHVNGNLGQDSILPIIGKPLNDVYVNVIQGKIEELKETTGNRDVSTGGTTSGVTAASAIAAMQEAGSKLSRDANKASYRVFRQVVSDIIELIRQFYDVPRFFRILGEMGAARYITYTNENLRQQAFVDPQGNKSVHLPVFDVKVSAEKQSPYTKMAQNELALQFYGAGFFAPPNFQAALACLSMMDFNGKDDVMQTIMQNGLQYLQMMAAVPPQDGNATGSEEEETPAEGNGRLGGSDVTAEPKNTRQARERTAESTAPR